MMTKTPMEPDTGPETGGHQQQNTRSQPLPTILFSALFTIVQLWAVIVILLGVEPTGAVRIALCCVISAAVMAVGMAWADGRGSRR